MLSAADRLRVKSAFDGQLFTVRHLLILREITRNLDLAQKDEIGGTGASGASDSYGVAGEFNPQTLGLSTHKSLLDTSDTVSSVLSRTSTLLPGSLFASLGGTRAERLSDAKRVRIYLFQFFRFTPLTNYKLCRHKGIDQDLKRACEAVISIASEPLCAPLRAFTGRPASAAEAAVLDEAFREACGRDLRENIARVRLYVPDARTAAVLVQHAVGRVEDAYVAFRLAARQVGTRVAAGEDGLMDDERLKALLKDVCGEEVHGTGP